MKKLSIDAFAGVLVLQRDYGYSQVRRPSRQTETLLLACISYGGR